MERVVEEEDLACCAVYELLETRGGDILRDVWRFDDDESAKSIMFRYRKHHDLQMWDQIKHKMTNDDHSIVYPVRVRLWRIMSAITIELWDHHKKEEQNVR